MDLLKQFLLECVTRFLKRAALMAVCMSGVSAAHAEDLKFKVSESFSAKGARIPYTLYVRLSEVERTRLGLDLFLDLQGVQRNLPGLLSSVLDETCKHKFAVAITETKAQGELVVVSGQFQAKFFACNTKDPKIHYRRGLLLSQNIDFVAKASAKVSGQCIRLSLNDVALDPDGFLGGAANLLGLTEKAQTLIVEKGQEALNKHPICPKLPADLASLQPSYDGGGTREIGNAGLGAALHGSVDTSSTTLLSLLAAMQERGLIDG